MRRTHDGGSPSDASGSVLETAGLERATLAVDVAMLAAVPAVLVAALALPRSRRIALALRYDQPTVLTAFASHFVHVDAAHLAANLVVYVLVVPVTYLLCLRSDRRAEFFVTFVTFVLAFPVALSVLNLAFVRPSVGLGFSGVNMAFVGFLPTALFQYLSERVTDDVRVADSPVLFFAGTAAIALIAVPPRPVTLGVAATAVLAALVYVTSTATSVGRSAVSDVRQALHRTGELEVPAVAVAVFGFALTAAFPSNPAAGGEVLNLFSHLLGYCLGFIVPYATFRLTDSVER